MEEKRNKTTAVAQHVFPAAAGADAGVGRWLSHTTQWMVLRDTWMNGEGTRVYNSNQSFTVS